MTPVNDDPRWTLTLLWQGQIHFPIHLYGENVEKYFLKMYLRLMVEHFGDHNSKTLEVK